MKKPINQNSNVRQLMSAKHSRAEIGALWGGFRTGLPGGQASEATNPARACHFRLVEKLPFLKLSETK